LAYDVSATVSEKSEIFNYCFHVAFLLCRMSEVHNPIMLQSPEKPHGKTESKTGTRVEVDKGRESVVRSENGTWKWFFYRDIWERFRRLWL